VAVGPRGIACLTKSLQATQGRPCFQAPFEVEARVILQLARRPAPLSLVVRPLCKFSLSDRLFPIRAISVIHPNVRCSSGHPTALPQPLCQEETP
jgi:hypothetical protein